MFGLIILCVAAVSAAPHYGPGYNPMPFHQQHHYGRLSRPYFGENVFDTRRFLSGLSNELRGLENMLADFGRRFPTSASSTQGIVGEEYRVTIPLSGFDEKDVIVKARTGLLTVQAIHKYEGVVQKNYLDVRTLPDCVNVNGSWTYSEGVLKLVFPLKPDYKMKVVPVVVGEIPIETPETPLMDNEDKTDDGNANVGLEREDTENGGQLDWRNTVKATTYAVDLANEV